MNILIIDDEQESILVLISMLDKIKTVDHIKTAQSVSEAIRITKTYQPDIVLLDIEMTDGSGFDFLEATKPSQFKVVFITAHKDYAIKAIGVNAMGYLLKPIDFEELNQILLKPPTNQELPQKLIKNRKILIRTQEYTFFVCFSDIVRLSSAGSYCIYHLVDGREIVVSHGLKTASIPLPNTVFFRAHHSHIINLNYVIKLNKVDGLEIDMKDQSSVPLSRRRTDDFLHAIQNLIPSY